MPTMNVNAIRIVAIQYVRDGFSPTPSGILKPGRSSSGCKRS